MTLVLGRNYDHGVGLQLFFLFGFSVLFCFYLFFCSRIDYTKKRQGKPMIP